MGSFFEEKVPFDLIYIKNEGFRFLLDDNYLKKRKSLMKERRLELAPIHLPTNHRLPIFEVSHVSVPKRETPTAENV